MSDETRERLRDESERWRVYPINSDWQTALTAHEQAVAAEAVLAFARSVDGLGPALTEQRARTYIKSQGWSETPGQAERGKP